MVGRMDKLVLLLVEPQYLQQTERFSAELIVPLVAVRWVEWLVALNVIEWIVVGDY